MAENLNYDTTGSKCNDCATYGRLYDWETAMKACPSGWHIPRIMVALAIFYINANVKYGRKLWTTQ